MPVRENQSADPMYERDVPNGPYSTPPSIFNYSSFSIDPSVQAALDAIKHGGNRAQTTLERLFNMGLVNNGANIDADWISQMLGQMPNRPGQFWGRVQRYMQTGELPRDYVGQGGGSSPIPESLQGAGGGGWGGGKWGGGGNDPFGGQLGKYLQDLIEDLRGRHGMDPEVLSGLYNQAATTSKNRERDRLLRRGSDFAASGLFGSGVQNRALQSIEDEESENLLSSKAEIGYANAQHAVAQVNQLLQALQQASGRELGLGQLDLGWGNLGLGYDQLDLQRELGLGNLNLAQMDMALQAAIQEWLMNQYIYDRF